MAFGGALGATSGSAPDIYGRFGDDPSQYWNDRLLASLIMSAVSLYTGAFMTLLGALMALSRDPERRASGRLVLLLSLVPHVANLIVIPVLTPQDLPHAIPQLLIILLIGGGLLESRRAAVRASS